MARRKPFTGFAAAGVEAPADRATGPVGSEELRGSPPALSPPPTDPRAPMFAWRHEANSPVSRFQTSPIMPRPYWVAAPEIVRSVEMETLVPPSTSSSHEV